MVLWDWRGVGGVVVGGDAEKKDACRERSEKFKIEAAALRRFALAARRSILFSIATSAYYIVISLR